MNNTIKICFAIFAWTVFMVGAFFSAALIITSDEMTRTEIVVNTIAMVVYIAAAFIHPYLILKS